MTDKNGKKRLSPYYGKRAADGFTADDFRAARVAAGLSTWELSELTGIAQSTISRIEQGKCRNPEARSRVIKDLGMTRVNGGLMQVATVAPAKAAPPKATVSADTDFAQWLIDNSTDELVVARAKYELLLAQRKAGVV